jgi:hypothetical protein
MRSKNTAVQITIPSKREPLSGIVTTALAAGSLVQVKAEASPTANGQRELVAADGTGVPAILENDVVSEADFKTAMLRNPEFITELRNPVPVNSGVSARFAHEAEFEGADFWDSITASSTAGTALTIASGKWKAAGEGDRVFGYLGRKVVPHTANAVRWTVDILG